MTDYTKMYAEKLTTADELAARVESGWSIGMDTSVSAAPAIVSAIARRAADGTTVRQHMLPPLLNRRPKHEPAAISPTFLSRVTIPYDSTIQA